MPQKTVTVETSMEAAANIKVATLFVAFTWISFKLNAEQRSSATWTKIDKQVFTHQHQS